MTLVETVSVGVVITVLTVLISSSLARLSSTHAYTRDQARLVDIGERTMRTLLQDATFSAYMFGSSADSSAYLLSLETPEFAAMPGSRLPTLTERGWLDKDPLGQVETGNVLFFGESLAPLVMDLGPVGTPDLVRVDRLRFVLYYLTQDGSGRIDLVRWVSAPLARLADLAVIANPVRRAEVGVRLYDAGVQLAWNPGAPRLTGLCAIGPAGEITLLPLIDKVPSDPSSPSVRMLGERRAQVAANGALQSVAVPAFAETSGPFPAGFEIKIDGGYGAKLLLVRLVLTSGNDVTYRNHAEVVRLVSCRDG